jgi:copper(I)-binding protein
MHARRSHFVSLLLAAALVVVACGGGAGAGAAGPSISDAWVRPPMGPDRPAAGYLAITGGSEADALIAASSPIASDTQVHETTAGMSGMAGMQEVDRIEVTAGTTVRLEPGGYHIMFMDPDATMLTVGETVEITLTFETAGDVTVEAEVRAG